MAGIVFPDSPTDGQTYRPDNNYVIYKYSSADDSWTGTANITKNYANPSPSDVSASPAFGSGSGTQLDPFVIAPVTVANINGTAQSSNLITITGTAGDTVYFYNETSPKAIAAKFNQEKEVIAANGEWQGYLQYNDAGGIDTSTQQVYVGTLRCGTTYFSWTVTQQAGAAVAATAVTPKYHRYHTGVSLNEQPVAVNGYYPLYRSQAQANAVGNGTSHVHFFNNMRYFMPNGVTFYHGNY